MVSRKRNKNILLTKRLVTGAQQTYATTSALRASPITWTKERAEPALLARSAILIWKLNCCVYFAYVTFLGYRSVKSVFFDFDFQIPLFHKMLVCFLASLFSVVLPFVYAVFSRFQDILAFQQRLIQRMRQLQGMLEEDVTLQKKPRPVIFSEIGLVLSAMSFLSCGILIAFISLTHTVPEASPLTLVWTISMDCGLVGSIIFRVVNTVLTCYMISTAVGAVMTVYISIIYFLALVISMLQYLRMRGAKGSLNTQFRLYLHLQKLVTECNVVFSTLFPQVLFLSTLLKVVCFYCGLRIGSAVGAILAGIGVGTWVFDAVTQSCLAEVSASSARTLAWWKRRRGIGKVGGEALEVGRVFRALRPLEVSLGGYLKMNKGWMLVVTQVITEATMNSILLGRAGT